MRSSMKAVIILALALGCFVVSALPLAARDVVIRPPAFDWDDWTPPKYVPNWEGVDHRILMPTDLTDPPSEPVRWTAQWEEREGCLIAWPLGWYSTYDAFCEIVDELQDVGVVYMLYHNLAYKSTISNILSSNGVSMDYCEWLNIPYNDNWTRDWGPQNIWGEESENWGIVDNRCLYGALSNNVNPELQALWEIEGYYESPILTEGGNLCTDGMGKVFCTSWCLLEATYVGMNEQELRDAFRDYLNVELTILSMPPVSPHLDMSAKLVDPETWIIGEWPPDDPNTPHMNEMIAILDTMTASTGNPYTIHRVQQPDRLTGGYWRTYTNSYMQNGKVLLAVYDVEQDSAAVAVFQEALPAWEIVPIVCDGFDGSGGAIHCSTHGIAWHGDDYLFDGTLSAQPVNPPVQIPAGGGTFDFDVTITSSEPNALTTEFWLEVTSPTGETYGPLYEDLDLQLDPGQVWTQSFSQAVPPRAPEGTYTYRACAGSRLPRVIACADSFNFEKMGVDEADPNEGWFISTLSSVNEIEAFDNTFIPSAISLTAFPNPFNPSTVISYQLHDAGIVNLSVYDIAGKKVTELVDGWQVMGVHEVTFDGSGSGSGMYIYRLTAGDFSAFGKMVLVK